MSKTRTLVWKKDEQLEYYNLVCNDYIKKIFEHLKQNPQQGFYMHHEKDERRFDKIYKYYEDKAVMNIKDFEKVIELTHYSKIEPDAHREQEMNTLFTITDYNNTMESDGGCGRCGMRYPGSTWFKGYAYNTGLDGDKPVEYEGILKTYGFFSCNCKNEYDELKIKEEYLENDDNAFYEFRMIEIRCSYIPQNIWLTRCCMLFDMFYMDIATIKS